MAMKPCTDATAADWISTSNLPWFNLVNFGPAGFTEHARLRFIPDPTHEGQTEHESGAGPDTPSESDRLAIAVAVLLKHSTTPHEVFIAFWDSYGFAMPAARFEVPSRGFFLYGGTIADDGHWDIAAEDQAPGQSWLPVPAFIWPADHAWCVAFDVDPHWAGIGGSGEAIAELLACPELDVATASPEDSQPFYL